MLSSFKRSIVSPITAALTHDHNPSLPPSNKALAALRAALSAPYPPGGASNFPLNFNLEVIENAPPNADQIRTILDYLPHLRDTAIHIMSPLALKWPIVVDWTSGRATAGDSEGKRDGEVKEEEDCEPKA
ncbi:hypothetical protein BGY98DRAFT_1014616, partial [Russula aff. rugulosa BPL654]